MRRCANCGGEMVWETRAYVIDGELWCEECFQNWVRDWLRYNPDDVARELNVAVVDLKEER